MCNVMKVQSSFQFKGQQYKVHFVAKDSSIFPVVEKLTASFFGFKLWTKIKTKTQVLSSKDLIELKNSKVINVVDYLRNFAQSQYCNNSLIS